MWQRDLIFPRAKRGFWHRFQQRWARPLQMLEEIISVSESLGADPKSSTFETMDKTYWQAVRSLHSRTCLHARSVLALLSFGLVDPALAQWRICHESATIASFIAESPEMASRYILFSTVSSSQLVKELRDAGDEWVLAMSELDEVESLAKDVREHIEKTYGGRRRGRDYAWSGLGSFREIEAKVFQGEKRKPRVEYLLASQQIHAAPNAGDPFVLGGGPPIFPVRPVDFGLSGIISLTSLSIVQVTEALMGNAAKTTEDGAKKNDLAVKCLTVGPMCWAVDPVNFCQDCGGYKPIASPPNFIPKSEIPKPCSCK